MSAYALPGYLFLPSDTNTNKSCSSGTPRKESGPLHEEGLSFSGNSATTTMDKETISTKRFHHKGNNLTCNNEFGIAVKAATIDPVRLIASCLGGANSIESHSRKDGTTTTTTPHKDAIQFELSISFSGRTYTCTRTLPRIIQLRKELIRELQSQRMRWQGNQSPSCLSGVPPPSSSSRTRTTDNNNNNNIEVVDIAIPELPECTEETAEHGTVGGLGARGFTMLQGLLYNYCPVMEGWLRTVADIVPPNTSQSLANFLWEPLAHESTQGPPYQGDDRSPKGSSGSSTFTKREGSNSSLASIVEISQRDEDDNAEEEEHCGF